MSGLSLTHCKYECKYHVVFAPKFRRQVIYGKIKSEIGKILRKLCEYKGIEILEANACPDHIHMLLIIPPKYSIAQVMGYKKIDLNILNESQDMLKDLSNYDVIINTIPNMILNEKKLQYVKKGALLIDLASNPGGIDKDETKKQGLKLIHALGLPGKVSPLSSAKFIRDIIYEDI